MCLSSREADRARELARLGKPDSEIAGLIFQERDGGRMPTEAEVRDARLKAERAEA